MSPDLLNTIIVILEVALAIIGGFVAALWISLVIWTFRDIRSRSRDVFAQLLATLLVLIFNLPGILLYLILRPQERLAETYERALEEEALLQDIEERAQCPGCKRQIEPDFILCPSCHTPLKKRCVNCDRVLHLKWNMCPYCGTVQAAASVPQERGSRPRRSRDFRVEEDVDEDIAPPLATERPARRSGLLSRRRRDETPSSASAPVPATVRADAHDLYGDGEPMPGARYAAADEEASDYVRDRARYDMVEDAATTPWDQDTIDGGLTDEAQELGEDIADEGEYLEDAPNSDDD